MKRTKEVKRRERCERNCNLYLAFDLGNTKWKLAFSEGREADEANWNRGVGSEVVGSFVAVFGVWGSTGGGETSKGSHSLVLMESATGGENREVMGW